MVNRGIALGLLAGLTWWVGLFMLILMIVIAVKTREIIGRVGIGLMIVGGLVNTYHRFTVGYVVDNLPMFGLGYNNLADYLIFFGLVLYGYSYYQTTR